ncbi:ubiquitin carboxyl-terminal hydrolase 6 [Trichodelitschia bisporula]|uniref:Ubiquitin carboxyl-terminal hydrolase n=1 Tax=Trichodelitschia bisporula TaxID=703511 RepID=A0A6G1I8C4_9PEZI|nr:ubiquitin carboxyl-terminal hydrolase 6 [Trichodelitschia bisporula]
MAAIPVIVKHQGKRYEVELDPTSTGETFKYQLYSLTGVEPDRQKILVKGGQLKDDTDLSTLKAKPGQTFMMMGTPAGGPALEKPKEAIRFLEDMTEAEVAQTEGAIPAGLQNLGNTCYMNATLQALRSIPELQEELAKYNGSTATSAPTFTFGQGPSSLLSGGSSDLTSSLRDLFKRMAETQEGFPPMFFLQALRSAFPQFAQRSREGQGYAQQDAEEAWSQIVSQLHQKLKLQGEEGGSSSTESFVSKYMAGKFDTVMECDDPVAKERGEKPVTGQDTFFKLNCHIGGETNHLRDGLAAGLKEQIEKRSETLDRDALYTKTSKISRLPKYLPVHFMRFDWRRTTNKKAKIMRKVTFPSELDAVEFCTDDLKKMLIPVRDKIRDVRKEEQDVERARKRQKRIRDGEENDTARVTKAKGPTSQASLAAERQGGERSTTAGGDTEMPDIVYKTDAEAEAERAAAVTAGKKEVLSLVNPELSADVGANQTGLYELRGVVAHQGISADSGHYTAFIKKQGRKDPKTGKLKEEDGKWWWFNDDKVTEVDYDRIESLAGGGQSHSALILLYRAVPLPVLDESEKA